ncbi:MAG: heme-copper oxidase subunit III [Microbacteriaceae bacterium]|nr:heme-copper oxidase subunit III [Cryobacterium sp.]MBX3103865.1 heme-copper oxidase subunit III [Cryobacterium sp.]MCC6375548.1 heme-copper oxidase subunit III [Microbacteriaceae bacterium]
MTSTSLAHNVGAPIVNRPNIVAVGTIVWLGSEVMFFAGLFAIYFTLRSTSPGLWAFETSKLDVPYALTNTIILLLSSVTCQMGVRAAEAGKVRSTKWNSWGVVEWFFLTYAMGAVFVIGQIFEYANLVSEHISISSNSYGSAFYITTGFHALHVTAGLVAFLLVLGRFFSVNKFTHKEATSAIVVSYYWHFVDVVWVGLFLVIYVLK